MFQKNDYDSVSLFVLFDESTALQWHNRCNICPIVSAQTCMHAIFFVVNHLARIPAQSTVQTPAGPVCARVRAHLCATPPEGEEGNRLGATGLVTILIRTKALQS